MKKIYLFLILAFVIVVLNSCCSPVYISYQPVSESKTITPFLFSEFVKAKKYRGSSEKYYYKGDTTMSLNGNSISLSNLFCPTLIDLDFGTSDFKNWDTRNRELTEWFKAMGIPLKQVEN